MQIAQYPKHLLNMALKSWESLTSSKTIGIHRSNQTSILTTASLFRSPVVWQENLWENQIALYIVKCRHQLFPSESDSCLHVQCRLEEQYIWYPWNTDPTYNMECHDLQFSFAIVICNGNINQHHLCMEDYSTYSATIPVTRRWYVSSEQCLQTWCLW